MKTLARCAIAACTLVTLTVTAAAEVGNWRPHLSFYQPSHDVHAKLHRPTGFATEAECLAFLETSEFAEEREEVNLHIFMKYQAIPEGNPTCAVFDPDAKGPDKDEAPSKPERGADGGTVFGRGEETSG